jgi:hypothetical protein
MECFVAVLQIHAVSIEKIFRYFYSRASTKNLPYENLCLLKVLAVPLYVEGANFFKREPNPSVTL